MPDYIFHIPLLFTEFGFLGPLIIFGIYCIDKRAFINVLIMCMLSAFINAYLKSIWQIPLDPLSGLQGWAFPSGHTQFNLVVWLVLIHQIRKLWLVPVAITISVFSYFSMIHFHYHNWYDIGGGIFFGTLVFLSFALWDRFFKNRQLELGLMCLMLSASILVILPDKLHHYRWLLLCLGMSTGLLVYLVLERLKYICIVSKLDRKHIIKFLLALIFIYVIKSVDTALVILICLKGFMLTMVSLLYVAKALKRE